MYRRNILRPLRVCVTDNDKAAEEYQFGNTRLKQLYSFPALNLDAGDNPSVLIREQLPTNYVVKLKS